ncbi:MAG: hypothetical protein JWP97_6844, partial [Labilithrix sp.]|nr:hypothetical protein [Labilithrix sp.]
GIYRLSRPYEIKGYNLYGGYTELTDRDQLGLLLQMAQDAKANLEMPLFTCRYDRVDYGFINCSTQPSVMDALVVELKDRMDRAPSDVPNVPVGSHANRHILPEVGFTPSCYFVPKATTLGSKRRKAYDIMKLPMNERAHEVQLEMDKDLVWPPAFINHRDDEGVPVYSDTSRRWWDCLGYAEGSLFFDCTVCEYPIPILLEQVYSMNPFYERESLAYPRSEFGDPVSPFRIAMALYPGKSEDEWRKLSPLNLQPGTRELDLIFSRSLLLLLAL